MNKIWAYIIAFFSVLVTSALGQVATVGNVNGSWYKKRKPSITPPNWVFPIVWTILYILIAIAFALELQVGDKHIIGLFVLNLILNMTWCFVFFELKQPAWALIVLLGVLATAIAIMWMTTIAFTKWLILPYVLWLIFAMILNFLSV